MGVDRGEEAAPLVVDNTMYVVSAYPNNLFALDLTRSGAPMRWEYQPHPKPASQWVACCDVVNRGAAYWDGKIFFNTLDGNAIAVDANTGEEVWKTKLGHINLGETMTMAPLVVKGKVLVGNSGGEFGVRGWITALDAGTGKIAWKAFSTGPDKDVLIGPDFQPFYNSDKGKDLGVKSWPPQAWMTGGGGVWSWIAYDPDLNLIYYGAGNPGPWNQEQRPGDNKWTAGIFARDPDTGAAKWFYQTSPHDEHDYDAVNEIIPVDGQMRKVLIHPDRDGYLYVIDRATRQLLSANPYGPVNSQRASTSIPVGRSSTRRKKPSSVRRCATFARPHPEPRIGRRRFFHRAPDFVYIPHANLCMDWESLQVNYISGTPYVGATVVMKADPGGNRGVLTAWDPVAGKPVWADKEDLPVWSGALVTAGDLVFYGTMEGGFKAVDAGTGKLEWQFKTGSGIIGQPIAYRGPYGREYIAILSGLGAGPALLSPAISTPRTRPLRWGLSARSPI